MYIYCIVMTKNINLPIAIARYLLWPLHSIFALENFLLRFAFSATNVPSKKDETDKNEDSTDNLDDDYKIKVVT